MARSAASVVVLFIMMASRSFAGAVESLPADATACLSGALPHVIASRHLEPDGPLLKTSEAAQLNRPVMVVLCGLDAYGKTHDLSKLRLYLAGQMLPESRPLLINRLQGYVIFKMQITPNDRARWLDVISQARRSPLGQVYLSTGLDDMQPFESMDLLTLHLYPSYTWELVVFLLVVLFGLIVASARTGLLRQGAGTAPFSLGLVQMTCWFYVVTAAYLYIWLITLDYNTVSESTLALLGISGATGLGAVLMDREKRQQFVERRVSLESIIVTLQHRVADLEASQPVAGSAPSVELQEKRTQLTAAMAEASTLPAVPPAPVSKGFVRDILSDGDGVSLHRAQIAVWTVVLGVIFVQSVLAELAMPALNATQLGLMGISSGTYIGFKWPEKLK